jgi:hypothetical protein
MKYSFKYYIMATAIFLCLTCCSGGQETAAQKNENMGAKKILMVYF